MIKQTPFLSRKVWGAEQWLVSALPGSESVSPEGVPLSALAGGAFPLLIKIITANDRLSVQVHPGDSYAALREGTRGKTECWYVLDAEPGAEIVCGIRGGAETARAVLSGEGIERRLYTARVRRGDLVYLPAGSVHALGKGITVLETQEASDITYRIYDWGRARETHPRKALDVITPGKARPMRAFAGVFRCPYFSLELIPPGDGRERVSGARRALVITAGEGRALPGGPLFRAGDAFFVPAGEAVRLAGGASALLITPETPPGAFSGDTLI